MKQVHPENRFVFRVRVWLQVGEVFYAGKCADDEANDENDKAKAFTAFRFVFGSVHFGMF